MLNTAGILLLVYAAITGDTAKECPMHSEGSARAAALNKRGDAEMGFSHQKSRHTFRLADDGGSIEVNATASKDQQTVKQIRTHLRSIAQKFAAGDFSSPRVIHGQVVPGTPEMIARKTFIAYGYSDTPAGGAVRIRTSDREALKAIHAFLRFQIEDHRTGDSKHVAH